MSSSSLLSSNTAMAVLLPAAVRPLVVDGGAELVVERRTGGRKRLFVRLPDETERRQRAAHEQKNLNNNNNNNGNSNTNANQHALEQLRWARATLWHDDRLQRYLRTADYMTWPPVAELTAMVDLVCSAKETDEVPDFVGASALKRAVKIITAEDLYPGLHPLKEETLTGKLLEFAATTGDGCAVGETLHEVNGNKQQKENKQEESTTSSVWVIDLNTQSFSLDEVIRLQLTKSVQEECVKIIKPSLAVVDCGNSWRDVIAVHRRSTDAHSVGLFCSIPDYITQFGIKTDYLAKAVSNAAEQGSRVRLRLGVYLTLVHRNEVYVIIRSSQQQGIGMEEEEEVKMIFEGKTGKNFDMSNDAGLLLRISEGENIENILHSRFLSPLASEYKMFDSVPLTPYTRMIHVVVEHNPTAIIHGSRVTGVFPENNEARADLLELLASREGVTHTRPQSQQQQQQQQQHQNITGTMAASPSSLALTGEQLRRGIDEAVFKTLSQEPMTKVALSAHVNMSRFRGLSNFDAILKDSLKRNTEYRGRKYYLKD